MQVTRLENYNTKYQKPQNFGHKLQNGTIEYVKQLPEQLIDEFYSHQRENIDAQALITNINEKINLYFKNTKKFVETTCNLEEIMNSDKDIKSFIQSLNAIGTKEEKAQFEQVLQVFDAPLKKDGTKDLTKVHCSIRFNDNNDNSEFIVTSNGIDLCKFEPFEFETKTFNSEKLEQTKNIFDIDYVNSGGLNVVAKIMREGCDNYIYRASEKILPQETRIERTKKLFKNETSKKGNDFHELINLAKNNTL